MKKLTILIVLGFLCLSGRVIAQSAAPLKPLAVGDTVPNLVLRRLRYADRPAVRLSDYRGKLLIIDFWASWCSSCIKEFPLLQQLQCRNRERVQILLVNMANTRDDEAKVQKVYDRYRQQQGTPLNLPTLVRDTLLGQAFPHFSLPHLVWIGPDGKVLAFTAGEELSQEHIDRLLSPGGVALTQKNDIDAQRPLFTNDYLPGDRLLQYQFLLRGYYPGLTSGTHLRRSGGQVTGISITNSSLADLYRVLFYFLAPEAVEKQIRPEAGPAAALFADPAHQATGSAELWSMDVIRPDLKGKDLYLAALNLLNESVPFTATLAEQETDCLSLRLEGNPDVLRTRGGPPVNQLGGPGPHQLVNQPLDQLVQYLNSLPNGLPVILEETGFTGAADIRLAAVPGDLQTLQAELRPYHLRLIKTKRRLPVLVIRQRTPSLPTPQPQIP